MTTSDTPFSAEIEQALLGGMLVYGDAVAMGVQMLTAGDFSSPAHRAIFTAISDLHSGGVAVDPVSVAATLGHRGQLVMAGGCQYLVALTMQTPEREGGVL